MWVSILIRLGWKKQLKQLIVKWVRIHLIILVCQLEEIQEGYHFGIQWLIKSVQNYFVGRFVVCRREIASFFSKLPCLLCRFTIFLSLRLRQVWYLALKEFLNFFFCGGSEEARKIHWVKWDLVSQPRESRG